MSKYEEFQQLFVEDGEAHHRQADICFDAIEELTRQIIAHSGWHPDDVEYISLEHPIAPGKPDKVLRFKLTGRNRERIRDGAVWMNDAWNVGIRLRLRPHVNVAFQPQEVMFVVPLLVKPTTDGVMTLQLEPDGTVYTPTHFEPMVNLLFERIQALLEQGIQHLLSTSHRRDELYDLGFVLDQETFEDLVNSAKQP